MLLLDTDARQSNASQKIFYCSSTQLFFTGGAHLYSSTTFSRIIPWTGLRIRSQNSKFLTHKHNTNCYPAQMKCYMEEA